MTCKDCIHYDVCELADFCPHLNNPCRKFKNKADFVEVVRCKDCTRVKKYKELYFCSCDNTQMEAYDFCSYGERKTDNAL